MDLISKDRFFRNVELFDSSYPNIGKMLREHFTYGYENEQQLTKYILNEFGLISTDELLDKKRTTEHYINQQITTLRDRGYISSLKLPMPGLYCHPRFFSNCVDQFIVDVCEKHPLDDKVDDTQYRIIEPLPLVFLYGIDLGYALNYLLSTVEITHLVIQVPNINRFTASLGTIEWKEILQKFQSNGKKLHFLLGGEHKEHLQFGMAWNYLIQNCPIFPLQTYYFSSNCDYNEYFKSIYKKINNHLNLFLSGWGYYDDELNQLIQSFKNIKNRLDFINFDHKIESNRPIIIIASGPSFDQRYNELMALKDKAFIISCASAITPLYKKGITPDLHFEMESDHATVDLMDNIGDPDYLSNITLVAPIQISPELPKFFKNTLFFIKSGTLLDGYLNDMIPSVDHCSPTCVNQAVSILYRLGIRKIYLYGVDLGFKDKTFHHSRETIYYEEDISKVYSDGASYSGRYLKKVNAVDGSEIYTDPFMDSARLHLEQFTAIYSDLKVYNISNGAAINGAAHLTEKEVMTIAQSSSPIPDSERVETFKKCHKDSCSFKQNKLDEKREIVLTDIKTQIKYLTDYVDQVINCDNRSLNRLASDIQTLNRYLELKLKINNYATYILLRGSFYHFMSAGLMHAASTQREHSMSEEVIQLWKEHLLNFSRSVLEHFNSSVEAALDGDQAWVPKSIASPET